MLLGKCHKAPRVWRGEEEKKGREKKRREEKGKRGRGKGWLDFALVKIPVGAHVPMM